MASFAFGEFHFLLVQETEPKEGHPNVRAATAWRFPVLLALSGLCRQAIHGLASQASASCLARYAAVNRSGLRCSALPKGKEKQGHSCCSDWNRANVQR